MSHTKITKYGLSQLQKLMMVTSLLKSTLVKQTLKLAQLSQLVANVVTSYASLLTVWMTGNSGMLLSFTVVTGHSVMANGMLAKLHPMQMVMLKFLTNIMVLTLFQAQLSTLLFKLHN